MCSWMLEKSQVVDNLESKEHKQKIFKTIQPTGVAILGTAAFIIATPLLEVLL